MTAMAQNAIKGGQKMCWVEHIRARIIMAEEGAGSRNIKNVYFILSYWVVEVTHWTHNTFEFFENHTWKYIMESIDKIYVGEGRLHTSKNSPSHCLETV